jgi:CBS domain-containing protein
MRIKIKDIMTSDPIVINAEEILQTALEKMESNNIRHLPVINDKGGILGIVSDRDMRSLNIVTYLFEKADATADEVPIKDLMTKTTIVVKPEDDATDAAHLMANKKFGAIPVVDSLVSGKIVGIVSYIDILKKFSESYDKPDVKVEIKTSERPDFDSPELGNEDAIIKQWELKLNFKFPENFNQVMNKYEWLHTSFNLCIPYRDPERPELIIFARLNDMLFAIYDDASSPENGKIYEKLLDSPWQECAANFTEWHEQMDKNLLTNNLTS